MVRVDGITYDVTAEMPNATQPRRLIAATVLEWHVCSFSPGARRIANRGAVGVAKSR
jgi:hypothetical protein